MAKLVPQPPVTIPIVNSDDRLSQPWQQYFPQLDSSVRSLSTNVTSNFISVATFGADPTGVNDSTSAIQSAINALGTGGGNVYFPVGTYKISSTINIGNGTSTTVSTVQNIHLVGLSGGVRSPFFPGYATTDGVTINWTGGGSAMFSINGPLQGWGLNNLFLNGNNLSGAGIAVSSGQFGECNNIAIQGCIGGIFSTSQPLGAFSNADSYFNTYRKLQILVPNINNGAGIRLTGPASGTSDTDVNRFEDVNISIPVPTGGNFCACIVLQVCDTVSFWNTKLFNNSSNANGVLFDYSANHNFPSSCAFFGVDNSGPASSAEQWVNNGSPGGAATTNYIYALYTNNGGISPSLPNLSVR